MTADLKREALLKRRREWREKNRGRRGVLPKQYAPFSLDPLLDLVAGNPPADVENPQRLRAWENNRLGMDRSTRARYERIGLTPFAADRVAMSLGYHPAEVWSNWWDEASRFLDDEVESA